MVEENLQKSLKQDCNESGLVVVRIEVDRNGKVVKADPGVKGTKIQLLVY